MGLWKYRVRQYLLTSTFWVSDIIILFCSFIMTIVASLISADSEARAASIGFIHLRGSWVSFTGLGMEQFGKLPPIMSSTMYRQYFYDKYWMRYSPT